MPHCQELSRSDLTVNSERKEKTRPRSRQFENAQREIVTSVRKVLRQERARNNRERVQRDERRHGDSVCRPAVGRGRKHANGRIGKKWDSIACLLRGQARGLYVDKYATRE